MKSKKCCNQLRTQVEISFNFTYLASPIYRQWLPRDKLEPLGVDSDYDHQKFSDNKKPNKKKSVMDAYGKALRHQRKIDDGDDEEEDDEPTK